MPSKPNAASSDQEMPYFLEPTLTTRVREYMNKYEQINCNYMTQFIIENYAEFKMKKFKVFKKSVIKAYNWEKRQKNLAQSNGDATLNSPEVSVLELKKGDCSSNMNECSDQSSDLPIVITSENSKEDFRERSNKKRKLDLSSAAVIPGMKKQTKTFEFSIPDICMENVLGIETIAEKIFELYLNFHPSMMDQISPSKSIMIMGPKGAGKSHLTKAIAGSNKVHIMTISVEDLLNGDPGSNSGCDLLEAAFKESIAKCPCILHITDLHVFSISSMGSSKWAERRLIKALESNITALNETMKEEQILVVGEYRYSPTQSIDSSLKSCFDKELFIPTLQKKDRLAFLEILTSKLSLDIVLEDIANNTPSYLPGDLIRLVQNAKEMAVRRHHQKFKKDSTAAEYLRKCSANFKCRFELKVCEEDFTAALKTLVPILKKDGFPTVPEVHMSDIGGMEDLKIEIYDKFLLSIERPELAEAYTKDCYSSGILLWGPPGCGKTLFAKAVANQAGINFLLISGAEVLKMYQGESERTIRDAFALAKSVSPCIIYFDEFEGICPTRTASAESGSKGTIVTTLLSELNGVQSREGVYVMASTNRPDVIDPALLRPGRFDTKLYVGLPDAAARKAIFLAETSNGTLPRFDSSVDLDDLSLKCPNFSGADCSQLIKVASLHAQKNYVPWGNMVFGTVYADDFKDALLKVKPSVSAQAMKDYEKLSGKYANVT